MKRILLLDNYGSDTINKGKDDLVISLDPEISYMLYRDGIKYSIPEDYYSEKELRLSEKKYFFEQLEWFNCFDGYIKKHIRYCREYNIPFATANYSRIKYVIDMAIIYSYIIKNIFDSAEGYDDIVYTHQAFGDDSAPSIFKFCQHRSGNRKMFRDLVGRYCAKKNIKFTAIEAPSKVSVPGKNASDVFLQNTVIKSNAKKIINLLRYKKLGKLFRTNHGLEHLNVFLMHAGSEDIDYPVTEFIKQGSSVYLGENGKIFREDLLFRRNTGFASQYKASSGLKEDCINAAKALKADNTLFEWIKNKYGEDVRSVVLPYLEYFLSNDSYFILSEAGKMLDFYNRHKISFVFSRGNSDINSIGPIIAARYMKGAKSVCTEHSCFALDMELFSVFEAETYDYTLTRDAISHSYFEYSAQNRYNTGCKFICSPHYLKNIENKRHAAIRIRKGKDKENIMYVEKEFPDRVRCFNNMLYPIAWYFEFQKYLIDYFGSQENINFIYKPSRVCEGAENAILSYIKDKGYTNISIFSKHFLDALGLADRVIVDYPAGAFFEAAVSGKPVLCVCADYFNVLDKAKTIFGRSLRQFSSFQEASAIIKEFIASDPSGYVVDLDLPKSGFMELFNNQREYK